MYDRFTTARKWFMLKILGSVKQISAVIYQCKPEVWRNKLKIGDMYLSKWLEEERT